MKEGAPEEIDGIDVTNVPVENQSKFISQVEDANEAFENADKAEAMTEWGKKTMLTGGKMMMGGGAVASFGGPAMVAGGPVALAGVAFAGMGGYAIHKGEKMLAEEEQREEDALDASRAQVPLDTINTEAAHAEMERALKKEIEEKLG